MPIRFKANFTIQNSKRNELVGLKIEHESDYQRFYWLVALQTLNATQTLRN